MNDVNLTRINPIRPTTSEAIELAKSLIMTARFGALGVLDPETNFPLVSRVSVACDERRNPILLISSLSMHTKGLREDKRCSLLLGEPGKGDPLAHPRITLQCEAAFLDRNDEHIAHVRQLYLLANPKSQVYIDFADFCFVRLSITTAFLNGGFGKAFRLHGNEL